MAVIKGTATVPPPIRAPTRIFWGEYDPILTPSRTERLGGFFTELEFGFAPGAGHFVHYETPDQAAEEVRRFFGRVVRDRASQAVAAG